MNLRKVFPLLLLAAAAIVFLPGLYLHSVSSEQSKFHQPPQQVNPPMGKPVVVKPPPRPADYPKPPPSTSLPSGPIDLPDLTPPPAPPSTGNSPPPPPSTGNTPPAPPSPTGSPGAINPPPIPPPPPSSSDGASATATPPPPAVTPGGVAPAPSTGSCTDCAIPPGTFRIDAAEIVSAQEVFNTHPRDNPDGGVWKQGWPYSYDGSFDSGPTLKVHLIPYTHTDPGWKRTFMEYSQDTNSILTSVINAMEQKPDRKFIWAEICFFQLWWKQQSSGRQETVRQFVQEGRFEFVTGGWVMADEANTHVSALLWELEEGSDWLMKNLGAKPRYGWAVDPFGHSNGMAAVLKGRGLEGMLIHRVHYAMKKVLAKQKQLEFWWRTEAGDMFTHMTPFYGYDLHHECGPDPSVCCQFDFELLGGGCPWRKSPQAITSSNVKERSELILDQWRKRGMLYRSHHVPVMVGADFKWNGDRATQAQYTNYEAIMEYVNSRVDTYNIEVVWSTMGDYFDGVLAEEAGPSAGIDLPVMHGSFYPYSDINQDYWTGYFNSRIWIKRMSRDLEAWLRAAEFACPDEPFNAERQALSLYQHHDGITGTATTRVNADYVNGMKSAFGELEAATRGCLNSPANPPGSGMAASHVTVYNPSGHPRRVVWGADSCREVNLPAFGFIQLADDPLMCPGSDETGSGGGVTLSIGDHSVELGSDGGIVSVDGVRVEEQLIYQTASGSGAYLMAPSSNEERVRFTGVEWSKNSVRAWSRASFAEGHRDVTVTREGVEVEIIKDIGSRRGGEEFIVRFKTELAGTRLCSDLNGVLMECHEGQPMNDPRQSRFRPMPSMAWIEEGSKKDTTVNIGQRRFVIAGRQSTGVASIEAGVIEMTIDRKGTRDDARGLGQALNDNVESAFGFRMLVEARQSGGSKEDILEGGSVPPGTGERVEASAAALLMRDQVQNPVVMLELMENENMRLDEMQTLDPFAKAVAGGAWKCNETWWTGRDRHVYAYDKSFGSCPN